MTYKIIKALKEQATEIMLRQEEGKAAYYALQCNYSLDINPYRDSPSPWEAYHWQCGFQEGYFEQNRTKLSQTTTSEVSFRSWGEDAHIDKYFARG